MSNLPNKQIGWSQESNLLWEILKQLDGLEGTMGMLTDVVPSTRTLTINGVSQDLSADRSWTVLGTAIGVVPSYSFLPAAPSVPGEFYWAENSEGSQWIPGLFGGTYYNAGLYYSNGIEWTYMETPYQAVQAEVDAGVNFNKFVTPLTFNNAAKWNTKQNTLTLTTSGSSGPATLIGDVLNIPQYTGGGGGGQTENFNYRFDVITTSSDPGSGKFRYNNVNPTLVTEIYLDKFTDNGLDMDNIIGNITGDWTIYIQQTDDATKFFQFNTSVPYINNTGWWTIPVTFYQQGSGGALLNNAKCTFLFINKNEPESVITQVISDGDTAHAPSGDAVFDALATKVNKSGDTMTGSLTATSFIVTGGLSTQFLKANGTLDSTVYQPLLTNPVTGTGTINTIAKFTSSSGLGNSSLSDDGIVVSATLDISFADQKGIILTRTGTNRNIKLYGSSAADNIGKATLYPSTGTTVHSVLDIVPRGTGLGAKGFLNVYNTDFVADSTNYEFITLKGIGASYHIISGKAGTGTNRPILLSAGFGDGTTNPNQMWLYANGNVGIGQTADDNTALLQVRGKINVISGLINTSPRPSLGVVGSVHCRAGSGTTPDDGFLRLSAGGGTTASSKTSIDISGSSTVADMDRNITFNVNGAERARFVNTGNFLINTTTDGGFKFDVQGTTRLGSTTTLQTAPTTSAGTYDILTRNISTGVIEKVLSSTYALSAITLNINGVVQDLTASRTWRTAMGDTGALTFAGLTYNSPTTINIGACKGWVIDNETNPEIPTSVFVNYLGQTNVTVTTVGSGLGTFVLLNSSGTIVFQNTFPTSAQRKTHIWLGKVGHPTGTITPAAVINEPDYITSPEAFSRDLFQALGPYINDGVIPYPNGPNLQFNITAGNIHGNGINFVNNRAIPNEIATGPLSPVSFVYRTQTGVGGGLVSLIDPTNYDVGGVITSVGLGINSTTIQQIFCIPGAGFVIQYGQVVYPSFADAVANVGREPFVVYPNLPDNAIRIGALVVKRAATALDNTADALFAPADKLGQLIGATSGISTGTFQTVYGNSLTPQLTTTSILGAVSYQRGSAADTDIVFQVNNGAGTPTFTVAGTGTITANSFVKTGGLATEFLMADGSVSIGGGGGGIGGSGTVNTILKFTAPTTAGNSNITDNGSVITLGSNVTLNGIMSSSNSGATKTRGLSLTNSGTGTTDVFSVTNTNVGRGMFLSNTFQGYGMLVENTNIGRGIRVENSGGGLGIDITNTTNGTGLSVDNTGTGGTGLNVSNSSNNYGVLIQNTGTGFGLYGINYDTGNLLNLANDAGSVGSIVKIATNAFATGYGIDLTNNANTIGFNLDNVGNSYGIGITNSGTGRGVSVINNNTGEGVTVINNGGGLGIRVLNNSTTSGVYVDQAVDGGIAMQVINSVTNGTNILSVGTSVYTGNLFEGQFDTNVVFKVEQSGLVTGSGFAIPGGTNAQFLMADGSTSAGGGGGTINGSGTANTITKWTGTTDIGDSTIFDNGTTVSIGTASGSASAKFQVDSTTQGILPPRMTHAQRQAIVSPATGLHVFCTDAPEGLFSKKSNGWDSAQVGQITITTAVSINASTQSNGIVQNNKNIVIANGANAINYTIDAADGFVVSIMKTGTAAITFVAGGGRTIQQMSGTLVLNGIAGSTASIQSVGTVDYLYITNF